MRDKNINQDQNDLPVDEVKVLTREEELEKQAADNLAGWKKALADYQNLQKESDSKIVELKKIILTDVIFDLLPIFDNYKTAIRHIPETEAKSAWAVGLEHILKLWESFLQEHGIEEIPAQDQVFDPHIHETIAQVVDKNLADQQVVEVKQVGYKIQEQVIRPAKVVINNLE